MHSNRHRTKGVLNTVIRMTKLAATFDFQCLTWSQDNCLGYSLSLTQSFALLKVEYCGHIWHFVTNKYFDQTLPFLMFDRVFILKCSYVKNSKWVWSGNTTITNRRQPRGTARKSRSTITRHQEDKLSKAISSLFPIKMIAILEWTKSNIQQNIEQL